jgi:hypothetical protein
MSNGRNLSPVTVSLYRFYKKDRELPKDWQPFLINRFLSFNFKLIEMCSRVDKYSFILDKDIIEKIFDVNIPQQKPPWTQYIKKPEEKVEEFNFILKELQKYYHWTDRELELNKLVIIKELENKEKLVKIMKFIGSDLKHFKKYGIEIKKPEHIENSGGLNKWL